MLNFFNRERSDQNRSQDQGHESQTVRGSEHEAFAQGNEETPLGGQEPEFPDSGDAQELHDAAIESYGQPYAHLVMPEKLEGAMGRAANYWHYGEGSEGEKMADAAGALAHGIGQAQSFEDGNKRTAYLSTRRFLNDNGYGHLSPLEGDDEELADHLIGHGEGTHSLEDTQALLRSRLGQPRTANILDHIHDTLDPRVWDEPAHPEPKIKKEHHDFIYQKVWTTFEAHGYDGMEKWLSLVFTGSLTTYQYSDESDVDISLFVDTANFPEWSRAEVIGIMVENCDGTTLPGTPFPLQCFVVPPDITREDLYKPGMRSGYELATDTWIVPPDKTRVHDVEHEMNEAYTIALENADKMERLLRYEPDKAVQFWHQVHKRRQRDMKAGKGDYAPSNITYKMLANRNLFPQISEASGEYIASVKTSEDYEGWTNWHTKNVADHLDNESETYNGARNLVGQGGTPEQLRDYALKHVIGPANQQAVQDAQEWNAIPEHDRLDHSYEDLKDKSPEAADLVNNLGFGPDTSDYNPDLIDPELVNWDELHQNYDHSNNENRKWEQQKAKEEGEYGWGAGRGWSPEVLKMVNAWMPYHGAPAREEEAHYPHPMHLSLNPIDNLSPEHYSGGEQGEGWQNVLKQGGDMDYTDSLGYQAATAHLNGTATPHQQRTMNAAMTQAGYTPEEIAQTTKQKWALYPNGERVNLQPQPEAPVDTTLDEPGEFTLPPNWTAST